VPPRSTPMEKSGMGRRVTELAFGFLTAWRGLKKNLNHEGH